MSCLRNGRDWRERQEDDEKRVRKWEGGWEREYVRGHVRKWEIKYVKARGR